MSKLAVRPARADEAALVGQLLRRARDEAGPVPTVDLAHLAGMLERPDVHVMLAEHVDQTGTRAVGVMVLRHGDLHPLIAQPAVHIEQLWVEPGRRRRGVARLLLRSAGTAAQRLGAVDIICAVPTGGREANRFLARLGFVPLVSHRAAAAATVLRRCQSADDAAGPGRDRVLARRRLEKTHRRSGALA